MKSLVCEKIADLVFYKKMAHYYMYTLKKGFNCTDDLVKYVDRIGAIIVELRRANMSSLSEKDKKNLMNEVDYDCRMVEQYLQDVKSGVNRLPDMESHIRKIRDAFENAECRSAA